MEQELEDLGFLLPAEFLTDGDLRSDFGNCGFGERRSVDASNGSSGFGLDPSVTGAGETESDEEELIADLTRKYCSSSLGDCNLLISKNAREGWKLPSSPQSTLCGCKPASEIRSNSATRLCSPQDAKDGRRWDLLYAAAEEAVRVKMMEETTTLYSMKHFEPPGNPVPVAKSQKSPTPAAIFPQNLSRARIHRSYHQLQAARVEQMRLQQMKNGGSSQGRIQGSTMSVWPAMQQSQLQHHQPASGMAAVFPRETGVKERLGTGVFMPRRFGPTTTETPKKSAGCSSVLLPDKVVHALNLKMDPIDSRVHGRHPTNNTKCDTAELKSRADPMLGHQRRSAGQNQGLQLPPEWTY